MDLVGFGFLMCVAVWIWFPEQVGTNIARTVNGYRAALDKGREA